MANQTIPITLSWGTVSADVSALDINQLGTLIAQQLSGALRADVTFILTVLSDPTTFQTTLIYNSTQGVFKAWNTDAGAYVPLTPFIIGDVKQTFVGTDQLSVGWVVLNGRLISAIPGLTTAQQAVLEGFFGVAGNLPDLVPANISNLPAADSFSGITKPTVLPAEYVFASLPVSGTYDAAEVQAITCNAEILRSTVAEIEFQASEIQDKADALLTALRTPVSPPLYSSFFCGYL